MSTATVPCKYCGASIPASAKKCRFCGEFVGPKGISKVLFENTGLLVTAGVSAMIILKLLAVSRFRPVTALSLVQAAGLSQVLMGVVIVSLTTLVLVGALSGLQLLAVQRSAGLAQWGWLVALSLLLLGGLMITPWPLAIVWGITLVPTISFIVFRLVSIHARDETEGSDRANDKEATPSSDWGSKPLFIRTAPFAIVGIVALTAFLSTQMWLPPEHIRVDGGVAIVGYVISDEGSWTTVLRDRDRVILRVSTDSISDRQLCELPPPQRKSWWFIDPAKPSLLEMLFGTVRHPPCPTSAMG